MSHSDTHFMTPPEEIRLKKDKSRLVVSYKGGEIYELEAEYLRVESPSAEVQGHGPSEKNIPAGKRHVKIKDLQPVGHYAIRIIFDDGHDSGIYSWNYLRELGRDMQSRFATYLEYMKEKGRSRD